MPEGLHRGASAEQRLLEAIRRHFRAYGGSPSYRDLQLSTGIATTDVGRVLRRLEAHGHIVLHRGRARGIELPDPTLMLSDTQVEMITHARGWTVIKAAPAVQALAVSYPIGGGTDSQLPVDDLLAQIDARATAGAGDDPSEGDGSE